MLVDGGQVCVGVDLVSMCLLDLIQVKRGALHHGVVHGRWEDGWMQCDGICMEMFSVLRRPKKVYIVDICVITD